MILSHKGNYLHVTPLDINLSIGWKLSSGKDLEGFAFLSLYFRHVFPLPQDEQCIFFGDRCNRRQESEWIPATQFNGFT